MENNTIANYGVCIGRFQCETPHEGHLALLNTINNNHPEMIILIGVSLIESTEKNPLSFNIRRMMLQEIYPEAIILPIKDIYSDELWSKEVDETIKSVTNNKSVLMYGSRDSFLNSYQGEFNTTIFKEIKQLSATERRNKIKSEEINSIDFRRGIIHNIMNRRPITYSTVDIVVYNEKNQILLAKKPNENLLRCIGGFVDRNELSIDAARREFFEETGGDVEISNLIYVGEVIINDQRYEGLKDGIITKLFIGKYIYGEPKPTDDIEELNWVDIDKIDIEKDIMPVHKELIEVLFKYIATHTGILTF